MTAPQRERWERIERFAFDGDGAVVTFEDKLVAATGWTRHAARRAIAEYRRYLFLAAEAGHAVSPSPAVDHVWHLHLLYTRNYWDSLCPDVLGFDFHHEPSAGTRGDRAKLDDWYARTLASYAALFGEPAPADVWPATPQAIKTRTVDLTQAVVLPRTAWRAMLVSTGGLIAALIACAVWLTIRT